MFDFEVQEAVEKRPSCRIPRAIRIGRLDEFASTRQFPASTNGPKALLHDIANTSNTRTSNVEL
jgi:hypothetical protein